jgi:hypothetical protein
MDASLVPLQVKLAQPESYMRLLRCSSPDCKDFRHSIDRQADALIPTRAETEVVVTHERIPTRAMQDMHEQGCLDGLAEFAPRASHDFQGNRH